jgi:hypothetical protein
VGVPPHPPEAETDLEAVFGLSIDLLCVVGSDGYVKRVNVLQGIVYGVARGGM